jgi:hypothetical protein
VERYRLRIDHLARSMRDLQNIGYELREKDVQATEQPIATRSAAGQIDGDGSAEVADRAASMKASVSCADLAGHWSCRSCSTVAVACSNSVEEALGNREVPIRAGQVGSGGWGGIRTPGEREPTPVFKTGALNHSATHPT